MSKSLSELFSVNGLVTPMPQNLNDFSEVKSGSTQMLNGDVAKMPADQRPNSEKIKESRLWKWIQAGVDGLNVDEVTRALGLVGDTITQWNQIKKDPSRAFQIVSQWTNSKTDGLIGSIHDVSNKITETVQLCKQAKKDPTLILKWAVSLIKSSTSGRNAKTDYDKLMDAVGDPSAGTSLVNGVWTLLHGAKGNWTESDKGNFEKSRQSDIIPDDILSDRKTSFYDRSDLLSTNEPQSIISGIQNSVFGRSSGGDITEAHRILDKDQRVNKSGRLITDYFNYIDPYESYLDLSNCTSIGQAEQMLRNSGYLKGYHDYAGFEMGSDHLWSISLFPYPHEKADIDHYNAMKRYSCTPPLPYYYLPNLWVESSSHTSSNRVYTSSDDMVGKERNFTTALKHVLAASEANYTGSDVDNLITLMKNGVLFSYSYDTPVLSYDLNLGTVKTESLKLFNGSASEIFAGMTFNASMNMSILDDVYGSMTKYMSHYINCVYDIHNMGLAPYYNAAFQINLTIFMPGSQIKYKYKFIGVPIEYTPRLSGQMDANESRVDITFGIIGYKPYIANKMGSAIPVGDERSSGKDTRDWDPNYKFSPTKNLTWADIALRLS